MTILAPAIDADALSERATTLATVGAVVLGAVFVHAVAGGAYFFYMRGSEYELARVVSPIILLIACFWLGLRGRRDGDRDALVGAILVATTAIAMLLLKRIEWLPRLPRDPLDLSEGSRIQRRDLWWWAMPYAPIGPLAVLALITGVAAGARTLRVPWHALLRPPRPVLPSVVTAVLAGVLLFPVLYVAQVGYIHLLMETSRKYPGLSPFTIRGSIHGAKAMDLVGDDALGLGLSLSLLFPGVELLMHGLLRRAFAGASALRFTVTTAVAASLILPMITPTFVLYGGCLVTGVLARRTESIVPGIVFWQAFAMGPTVWQAIVP